MTKPRAEKRTAGDNLAYARKAARTLTEQEWRCVMLTWAVTGWTCRCTHERLGRLPCNCHPSWSLDDARCASPAAHPPIRRCQLATEPTNSSARGAIAGRSTSRHRTLGSRLRTYACTRG